MAIRDGVAACQLLKYNIMKRITLKQAVDILAQQGYDVILTGVQIVDVIWKSPAKRIKHKTFTSEIEAAKYVLKRLSDPRFTFIRMVGATWVVTSLDTVKYWANQITKSL